VCKCSAKGQKLSSNRFANFKLSLSLISNSLQNNLLFLLHATMMCLLRISSMNFVCDLNNKLQQPVFRKPCFFWTRAPAWPVKWPSGPKRLSAPGAIQYNAKIYDIEREIYRLMKQPVLSLSPFQHPKSIRKSAPPSWSIIFCRFHPTCSASVNSMNISVFKSNVGPSIVILSSYCLGSFVMFSFSIKSTAYIKETP